jgi:hypothetical protein
METLSMNDQMSQILDRIDREYAEKFKQESLARYRAEQAGKEQKDDKTTDRKPQMATERG